MRKFYYVCPRCGRCYKRYIPRRKTKCGFCSTVWKTRGAKGTRSAFSWKATLFCLAALAGVAFGLGRELGVWRALFEKPAIRESTENSASAATEDGVSTDEAATESGVSTDEAAIDDGVSTNEAATESESEAASQE